MCPGILRAIIVFTAVRQPLQVLRSLVVVPRSRAPIPRTPLVCGPQKRRYLRWNHRLSNSPCSHVGKLYNVLAKRTAERIDTETDADFANVHMVSEIGMPIADPDAVDVETATTDHDAVEDVVREQAGTTDEITEDIIAGDVELF